jgi:hypothetical protein
MVAMRVGSLIWILVLVFVLVWSADAKPVCGPGTKATIESPDQCMGITTHDVLGAMHGLTSPPTTVCKNQIKIQGIPVCQDRISPNECTVVSIAITEHCNQTGTYEFERYWGSRCKVYIFHMSSYMTGCAHTKGKIYDLDPSDSNLNIKFTTNLMWQGGCFCCVFRHLLSDLLAPLSKIKRIDSYIHNNASTDAGLYWPGYFYTDITTPGKQWVAELRRNESINRKRMQKAAKDAALAAVSSGSQ